MVDIIVRPPRPVLRVRPSNWTSANVQLHGNPFSFGGREYLQPVYDSPWPKVFLKAGRQVEKCGRGSDLVLMLDGSWKRTDQLIVGDEIVGLDDHFRFVRDRIADVSENGVKPLVEIHTRRGATIGVTENHPIRKLMGFEPAGNIEVGDRIAAVRRVPEFNSEDSVTDEEAILMACMLGDGGMTQKSLTFTNMNAAIVNDFKRALGIRFPLCRIKRFDDRRGNYRIVHRGSTKGPKTSHPLRLLLNSHGLNRESSAEKFIPQAIYRQPTSRIKLFLSRLWGCDGSRTFTESGYPHYTYCTISERLAWDVQSLMWRCGIPTKLRSYKPYVYQGTTKMAWLISIETLEGRRIFEREVGKFGTKQISLDYEANSNRDTIPIEIGEHIKTLEPSMTGAHRKAGATGSRSLYAAGLRRTPKYALSMSKCKAYADFTGDSFLTDLSDSDVIWDEVKSVSRLPEEMTYAIQTEKTHTYVIQGIVTHNTTTLCNTALAELYCVPHTSALYVSSSSQQTSVFSTSVVKAMLMESPNLRGSFYRPGSSLYIDKVFEKEFTNHSRMFFRYAFLSADRCRGIAARLLYVDEIQDILLRNLPVIEECTSHYMANRRWTYSGTPKTYENAVEHYWRRSTMKEWVVKCFACNHWNILQENNVKEAGLSCEKCERLINPAHGQWARMGEKDSEFDGYRITQLMVPWGVWKELYIKYEKYPKQQFYNEVLGLSCETAASVLSQVDLIRACVAGGYPMYKTRPTDRYFQSLFGGVDWGKGLGSLTVHVIGGQRDGAFEVIYMKKYDPARQPTREIIHDIARVNFMFKVIRCGADWGSGFMENQELQREMRPIHVWQFMSSGTQKAMVTWNKKGHFFVINRNAIIGDLFSAIKGGRVKFMRWKDFEGFSTDFLCIFPDYHTTTRTMYYEHPADVPDDTVHATNYARTASLIYSGALSGLSPRF